MRKKKVKKRVKKKAVKKRILKKTKRPSKRTRPKARKKVARQIKKTSLAIPGEDLVGKIIHYFPQVKAGVIKVTKGTIGLGDTLHIKGHTTDFKQTVTSLQINRAPIQKAKKGDEIGLLVNSRVRRRDLVYKV
ncbi:MAG: hypothetical protein V1674_05455 [Candidatus Omnitrophota bacterium]